MNQLHNSSSLYLRQHANNPVNWYSWGDEAFERAKSENKPIIISIGYSSCHWCHVMKRESYEDQTIADYMNEHFISIKVDREEHPDVDAYYMFALQSMTGQGGWPLHIFATPKGEPIYGGTYFPPQPMHGRVSWKQILEQIADSWERRDRELLDSVEHFKDFIQQIENKSDAQISSPHSLDLDKVLSQMKEKMDDRYGGFSRAPKFPMLMSLEWMLDLSINRDDENAREMVENNIQQILHGGVYDQVQGGLMRYSVDSIWLVPHFEKMLYTQAQLIPLLAFTRMLRPNKDIWGYYLELSLDFLDNWMGRPSIGYSSAVDADSPDGEGYYYTFSHEEVDEVLPDENSRAIFQILDSGNFEGRHILHFADQVIYSQALPYLKRFKECQNMHTPPTIDPKRITSWNAFTAVAFARSFIYSTDVKFLQKFRELADFLIRRCMWDDYIQVPRIVYDSGEVILGVGEDFASLALVLLYRFRFDQNREDLDAAEKIVHHLEQYFFTANMFTNSNTMVSNVPQVKVDFMDDMIPDVNSLMLEIYQILAILTQSAHYRQSRDKLQEKLIPQVQKQPVYRAYAGRKIQMSDSLEKLETNLHWTDIFAPLPENIWLYKTEKKSDDNFYLQVCDAQACRKRIEGKNSCIEYFNNLIR